MAAATEGGDEDYAHVRRKRRQQAEESGRSSSSRSRRRSGSSPAISLVAVREDNLPLLRKLNIVLFPVKYSAQIYRDALAAADFSRLAYYGDECVGSIACRLEKKEGEPSRVYIMTLGVLAPYRELGIGTKLVSHVLDQAAKHNIPEIYLHVQASKEEAIAFYGKLGFQITATIQNYYKHVTARDSCVLTRVVGKKAADESIHMVETI